MEPYKAHQFRYYDVLQAAFVVVLLISNLVGQKICAFGPFRLSGAQLLFPITYIFGDVFTEVYGYSASRRAIWVGFFASALLALMGLATVALPPARVLPPIETPLRALRKLPVTARMRSDSQPPSKLPRTTPMNG